MNSVVHWEKDTAPLGAAVAAIGVFDGVHVGHQALVGHAAADARKRGMQCVAVTFDRDPDQVVTPDTSAPQLLTLDDKSRFLLEAGADLVLVIPFDAELAARAPSDFLEHVLLAALSPRAVHVGLDFRFGHFAEGNVATLRGAGEHMGFSVHAHELVESGGEPVTSTRIRALIAAGDVAEASVLLGRHHRVTGRVVHGQGIGRALLHIPTANLLPTEHAALPADGVYAGWACVGPAKHPAALSVGLPPTFPGARDRLEAHIIDLTDDLYGQTLTVGFARYIRQQHRFDSDEDLAAAIRCDIATIRDDDLDRE